MNDMKLIIAGLPSSFVMYEKVNLGNIIVKKADKLIGMVCADSGGYYVLFKDGEKSKDYETTLDLMQNESPEFTYYEV